MSASNFHDKTDAVIEAVRGRSVPGTLKTLCFAGIAVGLLGFGYGLFAGNPGWAWGALLVATFFAMGVSQGGVVFAGIMQGTQARWGRPLKRVGEAFGFYLPVTWLLLAVFLVGGGLSIYPWSPDWIHGAPISLEPHASGAWRSKPIWLSPGFFVARQLGGLGLLMALNFVFIRNAMGPDLLAMKNKLGADAPSSPLWGWMVGSGDAKARAEKGLASNYTLVPIMGMAYALIFSMFAFDLVMSVDPWWYSNMFGGWIFMSSILLGMGGIALFATLGRGWLSLGTFVDAKVTHDLGKLMLAGTMFWGYTLFAQILPIYYTDVPEETNFLLVRLFLPQWSWLAKTVAVLVFITPFTMLLSRGLKKMYAPFAALALISMFGLFLERTLLVMPSVYLGDAFPWMDFLLVSIPVGIGVMSGFVLTVSSVLAKTPAISVTDPLLDEHPWDQHVHALGSAHH